MARQMATTTTTTLPLVDDTRNSRARRRAIVERRRIRPTIAAMVAAVILCWGSNSGRTEIPRVMADDGTFSSSFSSSSHQLRAAGGAHHHNQQQQQQRREEQQRQEDESVLSSSSSTSSGTPHMTMTSSSINTDGEDDKTAGSVAPGDDTTLKRNDGEGNNENHGEEERRIHDERFLQWCRDTLGISTDLIEIDYFPYYDYLQAMEDRVDIFFEDCKNNMNEANFASYEVEDFDTERLGQGAFRPTPMTDDYYNQYDEDLMLSVSDYPMLSIRGLKASHDIQIGQVLIQIPHASLWTLANVVDSDPVLAPVIGLQARKEYGWDSPVDEIPLLSVALLYHFKLGRTSPYWPYLQQLLGQHDMGSSSSRKKMSGDDDNEDAENSLTSSVTIQDAMTSLQRSIPHLWSPKKLRKSATPAIRSVSKGIQRDVLELYETIVLVLIEDHPHLFGETDHFGDDDNPIDRIERSHPDRGTAGTTGGDSSEAQLSQTVEDWMYSLEKFHWAFALVNSRHWHLPIPSDLLAANKEDQNGSMVAGTGSDEEMSEKSESASSEEDDHVSFSDQEGPPASTPTDEWLDYQRELQRKEEEAELQAKKNDMAPEETGSGFEAGAGAGTADVWPDGDSFLAPVADLINFGPPCTRGLYNRTTDAFEIVATCDFLKGQEITFFYTDACEDVFVANYGFTEPSLVPKCADPDRERIQQLESMLQDAWQELDMFDSEVDQLLEVLHDCHCENQTDLFGGRIGTAASSGNDRDGPPKHPSPPSQPQHRASPPAQRSLPKDRDRPSLSTKKTNEKGASSSEANDPNVAKHAIRGRNRRGGSSSNKIRSKPQRDVLVRNGSDSVNSHTGEDGYTRRSEF